MRGLTKAEAGLLEEAGNLCNPDDVSDFSAGDSRINARLFRRGLLSEPVPCACGWLHLRQTATGALALRIHQALRAGKVGVR